MAGTVGVALPKAMRSRLDESPNWAGDPIRDKLRKSEICQGEKDLMSNSD